MKWKTKLLSVECFKDDVLFATTLKNFYQILFPVYYEKDKEILHKIYPNATTLDENLMKLNF